MIIEVVDTPTRPPADLKCVFEDREERKEKSQPSQRAPYTYQTIDLSQKSTWISVFGGYISACVIIYSFHSLKQLVW